MATNGIFTEEDAEFLRRRGVLPDDRTARCTPAAVPHIAIRDDITAHLDAVEAPEARPDPDLTLVEEIMSRSRRIAVGHPAPL